MKTGPRTHLRKHPQLRKTKWTTNLTERTSSTAFSISLNVLFVVLHGLALGEKGKAEKICVSEQLAQWGSEIGHWSEKLIPKVTQAVEH